MAQVDSESTTAAPKSGALPPRSPTSQERADELLMRWRLARAAGIPPHLRLEQEVHADHILRVGSLELDLVKRRGRRGDRSFDLQAREARLLKYMMERNGQLLTSAQLFRDVWFWKFVPKNKATVQVCMGNLRRKINGSNEPPMIRSMRGKGGHILEASVEGS
jgi:DNA-binding response OmpR family regulator